jgi:DNA-binding LytR/AlgR family response regulator
MKKVKAIIADDEDQLRSYLKSRLSDVWPELIISGEARNGQEALEMIQKTHPHIAFLDIRMPVLSGMEVAKKIGGSCWVVFITAYDQYAVEAFESEAIDYLLKPVTRERLEMTTNRLKKQIATASEPPADLSKMVERMMTTLANKEMSTYLQWIRTQQGEEIRLIAVEEVYYFKASDKYTLVITKEGESLIRKPIKELADELDPNTFWRIHRGTIVNAACIDNVSRSLTGRGIIRLKDLSETLTVSRSYIHIFRQM